MNHVFVPFASSRQKEMVCKMKTKSSEEINEKYAVIPHVDAALHTRGESQYVDDVPQPAEMLHAAVFGSPVAHGKLLGLNLDAARNLNGVVAILTADDIPGENQVGPLIQDEELLASREVHFMGNPIAVVVAITPEIARKAVQLIEADIEPLPVVVNPKTAFEKGQIIGTARTFEMGNVDAVWSQCDIVVEGVCDIGGQEHVYLETQRARAIPTENGAMRVYASTQSPFAGQRTIANILGLPYHKIEVDVKRLGGGFGGKEDQATPYACMAALAAWHTQKPVELVLNREDDMRMTGKRHPYISDFKLGLDRDGKILAYDVKHYQNAGASADLSPAILERTLFHATNAYYVPNARIFAASCRTNLPSNTAFRGFGGPQGMFVIESAIAKAAEKMGISREEIQHKNLLRKGDLFPYGQRSEDDHVLRTWNEAAAEYDFVGTKQRVDEFNSTHFEIKKGLAMMPVCFGISFTATFLNQASALVHVYTDGSVSVTTGGIEMGQGLSTNIAIVAARTFGIAPDRVKVESTNTTRVANMSPSAASATSLLNGNATLRAARQILDRLKSVAADMLNRSDREKIQIVEERVLYDGSDSGLTWQEVVQKAYLSRVSLSAQAFFATPDIFFDKQREKGRPFAYYSHGAAIVEVTLDCLRGRYTIDAVKIVHDLGRPINKLVDLGQVEGGLAQGLGWMTLEDLQFADDGRIMSHALATYKVPDVYFMPDDLRVKFLENSENELGPFGSKAVGEPPLMYGIGAFFALRYAMKAFRPDIDFLFDSPLTPERALMQLHPEFGDKLKIVNGKQSKRQKMKSV